MTKYSLRDISGKIIDFKVKIIENSIKSKKYRIESYLIMQRDLNF